MNYKISVKAAEDLENIWLYTFEHWSYEQADRYINLIIDEIEYLAQKPELGNDPCKSSGRTWCHTQDHFRVSRRETIPVPRSEWQRIRCLV